VRMPWAMRPWSASMDTARLITPLLNGRLLPSGYVKIAIENGP
jgi:hypothetical protein